MNFSTIIGFFIAIAVLVFAIAEADTARSVLLDSHALMIVLGGTIASSCISFPIQRIFKLTVLAVRKLLGMVSPDYQRIIRDVIDIADGVQRDPGYVNDAVQTAQHPFLREGLQLLADGATEEQLVDILESRIETFRRRYQAEVNMFRTIGKFPPAFGLLGTTFGMITLLNQLGKEDAQKTIGPAMAIGLVATLYGIALTNFVFIPIAENLNALGQEDYCARRMVIEGLVLVKRKTHPFLVEEKMKSFLLPSERDEVLGTNAANPSAGTDSDEARSA